MPSHTKPGRGLAFIERLLYDDPDLDLAPAPLARALTPEITMDEGDRIYMTEILTQIRVVKERLAENEKEHALWAGRVAIAEKAGKLDLAEAARERADHLREQLTEDEKVLMELEVRKGALKNEIRAAGVDDGSVARANKMIDSLKETPWAPQDARLDRIEKEATADDALAALKKKMGF